MQKFSKKLHLSKFKLARFNDSCQFLVFYFISFAWGFDVIIREGYIQRISLLWDQFPKHPMIFLHKLYFIIQLAYYFHILPEIYFQKVKKEAQQAKIVHSICSFSFIALAYFTNFQRIALVLLTLHYISEVASHMFQLLEIFDRDEKFINLHFVQKGVFLASRFATMVLAVLTLHYGIQSTALATVALIAVFALQSYLIFQFINNILRTKREEIVERSLLKKRVAKIGNDLNKTRKDRKRESDLPEADQNTAICGKSNDTKKLK